MPDRNRAPRCRQAVAMLLLTGLLLFLAVAMIQDSALAGQREGLSATPLFPSDNERLGFGVTQGIENYDVSPLKAGWYVNWGTAPQAAHPAGLDFAQIIRTSNSGYSPSGNALLAAIDRNPGSLWLIGNEPDCPYQDNTLPANYARIYHDAYQVIKGRDPTAQVAIGGIVQATPLRMQWLDMVWNEYLARYGEPMPVDVWNVHAFVLREVRPGHGVECQPPGATEAGEWGSGIPPGVNANCGLWIRVDELDRMDLFREHIVRFRTWMRDHGQQNKPLIVSEYGILFNAELGYGYERVRNYMLATFDYFMSARDPSLGYPADDYHLVQRWAWYSLDDDSFGWGTTYSALMNPKTRTLYPLGYDFARYASQRVTPYVDLQPVKLLASLPGPIPYGQDALVRFELEVRNQGNTSAPVSQARFWQGNPDQGGTVLGTTTLPAVPSRYNGTATAVLQYDLKAQGRYEIVAQADALNQVAEAREDNNRLSTTLDFGTVNLSVGRGSWLVERGPLRAGEPTLIRLSPVTVVVSQPATPGPGLEVTPPPYRVTWYDGNPDAGGQMIASHSMPAPARFGACQATPAQTWAPVITASRPAWLVVTLEGSAAETTLADNRTGVTITAAADLTLVQARQLAVPLVEPGQAAKVQLSFQVANLGTAAPAGTVQVGVWSGMSASGPELGRAWLAESGEWTEPITWAGLEVGGHQFVAVVDPDNLIAESNEANNLLTGWVVVARGRDYLPLAFGARPRTTYVPVPVFPDTCWR